MIGPRFSVFFFLLGILAMSACGGSGSKPKPVPAPTAVPTVSFPVAVPQSDGQPLTLTQPPARIVSLSQSATAILCDLAAAQLVAVETHANCPAGSKAKPELDAAGPGLDQLVGFAPDLVVLEKSQASIGDRLRQMNIAVLTLSPADSLDGLLQQMDLLGKATNNPAEANVLVAPLRRQIDALNAKLKNVNIGPRVYHELDDNFGSVGPGSFTGDLYKVLKAQNIASNASSASPQLSSDLIVQRNPEVIVLTHKEGGSDAASIAARPGWEQIDAVKKGRICEIDAELVNLPGPRIDEGLKALAPCLYPDLFK